MNSPRILILPHVGHPEPSICPAPQAPSSCSLASATTTGPPGSWHCSCRWHKSLAGIRGNCHITVTPTQEDKFTYSQLLAAELLCQEHHSPATKPHLLPTPEETPGGGGIVLSFKEALNGRGFKV